MLTVSLILVSLSLGPEKYKISSNICYHFDALLLIATINECLNVACMEF